MSRGTHWTKDIEYETGRKENRRGFMVKTVGQRKMMAEGKIEESYL